MFGLHRQNIVAYGTTDRFVIVSSMLSWDFKIGSFSCGYVLGERHVKNSIARHENNNCKT